MDGMLRDRISLQVWAKLMPFRGGAEELSSLNTWNMISVRISLGRRRSDIGVIRETEKS